MKRYGIARWLSQEQRERAARATYAWYVWSSDALDNPTIRTTDGYCPLGVAFDGALSSCPVPTAVAAALSPRGYSERIRRAAMTFVHDVDAGLISPDQVAAALGVETP